MLSFAASSLPSLPNNRGARTPQHRNLALLVDQLLNARDLVAFS